MGPAHYEEPRGQFKGLELAQFGWYMCGEAAKRARSRVPQGPRALGVLAQKLLALVVNTMPEPVPELGLAIRVVMVPDAEVSRRLHRRMGVWL